jgi:uncharacterized protein (DUF427 family)
MSMIGKLAHKLSFEDRPGRVRASVDGKQVFDTTRAKLLREGRLEPRVYVPVEDLNKAVLEPSDHSTHCPFKGDASYWSIRVGDRLVENAIWTYPKPIDSAPWLEGYASVYREKVDDWVEEDAA